MSEPYFGYDVAGAREVTWRYGEDLPNTESDSFPICRFP